MLESSVFVLNLFGARAGLGGIGDPQSRRWGSMTAPFGQVTSPECPEGGGPASVCICMSAAAPAVPASGRAKTSQTSNSCRRRR